jgi:hypothetical protein
MFCKTLSIAAVSLGLLGSAMSFAGAGEPHTDPIVGQLCEWQWKAQEWSASPRTDCQLVRVLRYGYVWQGIQIHTDTAYYTYTTRYYLQEAARVPDPPQIVGMAPSGLLVDEAGGSELSKSFFPSNGWCRHGAVLVECKDWPTR